MSENLQGEKGDEQSGASPGNPSSPCQEYWDTRVPELTCQEKSLDDDTLENAMEPSASQDMDIKGIVSRKGKAGLSSKGRQRASTIKYGKGKSDSKHGSKRDLEKPEDKGDALLAKPEEKEMEKKQEEKPEEEMKKNEDPQKAEPKMVDDESENHA